MVAAELEGGVNNELGTVFAGLFSSLWRRLREPDGSLEARDLKLNALPLTCQLPLESADCGGYPGTLDELDAEDEVDEACDDLEVDDF